VYFSASSWNVNLVTGIKTGASRQRATGPLGLCPADLHSHLSMRGIILNADGKKRL